MTGQTLNTHGELKVLGDAWVFEVKPCMMERVGHRIGFAAPLPLTDKARQPAQRLLMEPKCLAHFTGGRLASIRDDICGHRRSQFSITPIYVLDGLFTLIFGGYVQVDI